MIEQTLLQRLRPEQRFAKNIASAIEQMRQKIGRATGGSPAQEVALGNLRDYVAQLGCDDQSLLALAATARAWPGRGAGSAAVNPSRRPRGSANCCSASARRASVTRPRRRSPGEHS